MTNQEVFDIVARHLLTQNEQSVNEDGCAYRGEGGLKCAVGALIPDSDYDPDWEGQAVVDNNPICGHLEGKGISLRLASRLQHIHDQFAVRDWRWRLMELAENEGLDWFEINQGD